jgi:cardiolipin synthase
MTDQPPRRRRRTPTPAAVATGGDRPQSGAHALERAAQRSTPARGELVTDPAAARGLESARLPRWLKKMRRRDARWLASHRFIPGHKVDLLRDGGQAFPAMLEAIACAQKTICLETYIFRLDGIGRRFGEALMERAAAGVEVNFIYDDFGSIGVPSGYLQTLERRGVRTVAFRPFAPWKKRWGLNQRDHRKLLVVDARVAFVGGMNLSDDYASLEDGGGGWRDTQVRIEGPGVAQLIEGFLDLWRREGGAPIRDPQLYTVGRDQQGDMLMRVIDNSHRRERRHVRRSYLGALEVARKRVYITSAYFLPDRKILRAMRRAVQRGVEVAVIVAGQSDVLAVRYAASHLYTWMLKAGIQVYEWTERVLHAKTAVVDGLWSTVGSYNLDHRSLVYNLELNVAVLSRDFGDRLEAMFEEDRVRCQAIELETWKRRPALRKFLEWFFYLFRFWL